MPVDEPRWWYRASPGRRAHALAPLGHLYGAVTERRFRRRQPYQSRLPVLCVGNLTAGGTGKTPLALLIAEYLQSRGETPVLLTRGHGGETAGPRWVDPATDTCRTVGDEALLLARVAPTIVARDRRAGAQAIERGTVPASAIIMDDGLQNPALGKDLAIAVVDGARGFGNRQVIPAGPLRAPLEFQLGLVHVIVVNGPQGSSTQAGETALQADLRRRFAGPVLTAEPVPTGDTDWLRERPVVAYAGIGHPQRFFDMLGSLGAAVVGARAFADHHVFDERDAGELLALADASAATLVTTEKDLVRLADGIGGLREQLGKRSRVQPIRLVFRDGDGDAIAAMIDGALKRGGYRRAMAQR